MDTLFGGSKWLLLVIDMEFKYNVVCLIQITHIKTIIIQSLIAKVTQNYHGSSPMLTWKTNMYLLCNTLGCRIWVGVVLATFACTVISICQLFMPNKFDFVNIVNKDLDKKFPTFCWLSISMLREERIFLCCQTCKLGCDCHSFIHEWSIGLLNKMSQCLSLKWKLYIKILRNIWNNKSMLSIRTPV